MSYHCIDRQDPTKWSSPERSRRHRVVLPLMSNRTHCPNRQSCALLQRFVTESVRFSVCGEAAICRLSFLSSLHFVGLSKVIEPITQIRKFFPDRYYRVVFFPSDFFLVDFVVPWRTRRSWTRLHRTRTTLSDSLMINPLKSFLGDLVEFEHNERDNDFTKIPHIIKRIRL